MNTEKDLPLISVVIPAYNYAQFLDKAIESVLHQTYNNIEIIVVDDGSTDATAFVVKQYPVVKYFYQTNKGLSAARNAGVSQSTGKYIVFLDADDWLEINALEINYSYIQHDAQLAFVSGNYYFFVAETNELKMVTETVHSCHYIRLLQSNYIGMHATVMFQRWVFNYFLYDENLKACEDYDLYLRITRLFPVQHHDEFIATYYFHTAGMSHNYKLMMESIKTVLSKQKSFIQTESERLAYNQGLLQWKEYDYLMQDAVQL